MRKVCEAVEGPFCCARPISVGQSTHVVKQGHKMSFLRHILISVNLSKCPTPASVMVRGRILSCREVLLNFLLDNAVKQRHYLPRLEITSWQQDNIISLGSIVSNSTTF